MSMFGWGVGDIIAISRLAVIVYTAYKDAPEDYRHISDEVESLKILIDKAAPYFGSTTLNTNSRPEGQKALKGCKSVLEDLNSLIEKYNSSGSSRTSQVLKRIKLGTEDIGSLRVRLISNTALLNGFIQSCESREIREMQEQMGNLQARMAGVLGIHPTTSRVSLTSLPGSINTKKIYKRFCKNLFQMGVTSEMITQKEGEILNMFNNQPQNTATGNERDSGGNITDQSQLPTPTQPRFRPPIDFLVGPLMLAAATAGNTKRLISTLEYIRNIDFKDDRKETALHKAVYGRHMDIVQLLLQKGASTEATNNDSYTPLGLAAQGDDLSMAELLLEKGASIEAMHACDKNTILHLAAKDGHTSTVELLLEKGASMEARAWSGTPLHLAAGRGHTRTVELLLENGASIKARNRRNKTPLHLAAENGHTIVVELFLEEGSLIEARGSDKRTPLHLAAGVGHTRTVELLLDKGASVEARGRGNQTPLHLAAQNGCTSTVELLLRRGASVEARDRDTYTPLHLAAMNGHTSTAEVLLEKGTPIFNWDQFGRTPLDDAVRNGHTDTAKLLRKVAAQGNHA